MKIGIYLANKGLKNIDMRFPENGNMGIGGTEYEALLLARYLTLLYDEFEVTLYAFETCEFPENLSVRIINSPMNAAEKASEDKVDIFIIRNLQNKEFYEAIIRLKLKTIVQVHNFYNDLKELEYISDCDYVKRNVYVSRQEYDFYIDHPITNKSTWIYNMINPSCYPKRNPDFKPVVVYMSGLVPPKRFHILARQWRSIVKKTPAAKLKVIGGGALYSRNNAYGKYGIASESYEKQFIPYLLDENGDILKSVEFLGVLGQEKQEILKEASVAVIASSTSETFCITAVEFEAMGIPVVAKKGYGLLDTVKHKKTGLMFDYYFQMKNNVIRLLNDRELNISLGENGIAFVRHKFSCNEIIKKWHDLFYDIQNDTPIKFKRPDNHYFKHLKFLKIINRKFKKISFFKNFPCIVRIRKFFVNFLRSIIKRV